MPSIIITITESRILSSLSFVLRRSEIDSVDGRHRSVYQQKVASAAQFDDTTSLILPRQSLQRAARRVHR